ncbi:MAG: hypothetical protein AAFO61_10935 [Pseudomonadota bacterium]
MSARIFEAMGRCGFLLALGLSPFSLAGVDLGQAVKIGHPTMDHHDL